MCTDMYSSSSTLGSIGMAAFYKHQPTPAYKVAKAALNMLTVQYAHELESEHFTVLAVCPGVSSLSLLLRPVTD
jgi:NAD(P)-dependent dehydrogenase (short-subunit alcohol dehydrogenase family)